MFPQRTVMLQNTARALSVDVNDDLPVNPLYCILYTLRTTQLAVSAVGDFIVSLRQILANVSRIEVLFRGSAIVSGSLQDIMVMNALLTGRWPFILNQGDATGRALAVTVPIYLGRPWMMGAEAFPATRRGELTLHRTFGSAFEGQGVGTLSEQVEVWEMLDSTPASFLKYVSLSQLFASTGDTDFDLPMGNPLLGALLWGEKGFESAASDAVAQQVRLLVDNVEFMYAAANWETLHGELNERVPLLSEVQDHVHTENLAVAYAAGVDTTKPGVSESVLDNYAYLDFDRWRDGKYAVQTAGRGRVHLRVNVGSANGMRVLPLEVVGVPGAAAA